MTAITAIMPTLIAVDRARSEIAASRSTNSFTAVIRSYCHGSG